MGLLERPERAFAVLAATFGVAFAIATPPLQVPDEGRHLMRAYMIARGQILADFYPGAAHVGVAAAKLPVAITGMEGRLGPDLAFHPEARQDPARIRAELARPLEPERTEWHVMPSFYSPLVYLPQAASIRLARLWDAPPIAYVYLGRLANLALYVALGLAALRMAPAHRWTLLLLALTPMSLSLAASLSADAATNGLALLFLAAVLRECVPAPQPGRVRWPLLCLLAALLGLAKQSYWPLAGLVLLIPTARFGSARRRAAGCAGVVLAALLTWGAWLGLLGRLDLPVVVAGADPKAQMRFLLESPLAYAAILGATVWDMAPVWGQTYVGVLGHLDTPLPAWLYAAWAPAVLALALFDGGAASPIGRAQRGVLLGVAAATFLVTLTLVYVAWNPLRQSPMGGIQGRYFIPFAPLGFLALHLPGRPGLPPRAARLVPLFCALVLATALAAVAARYWGA